MSIDRRTAILLLGGTAAGLWTCFAKAAKYPSRFVRLVVPYGPGGGADIVARIIGPETSKVLGQNLVIENHGGANGNIGAALVAHSKPDGYTIMLAAPNLTISQGLYKDLPFNVLSSFAPISMVAKTANILVVNPNKLPIHSLRELIDLAKKSPGKYNYASDQGGPQALSMALLTTATGLNLHEIPYIGTGAGLVAVMAGQVDMVMAPASILLSHINSGQLRAIAISSSTRLEQLPNVPTIAESGVPGFDVNQWYGVFAPAGTPKPIVDILNRSFKQALKSPDLVKKLKEQVTIPVGSTAEEFAAFLKEDIARWGKAIKAAHLSQR